MNHHRHVDGIQWKSVKTDNRACSTRTAVIKVIGLRRYLQGVIVWELLSIGLCNPLAAQPDQNRALSQGDIAARQANQPFSGSIVPSNPYLNDGIEDSPWYTIPSIVQQLKLTSSQISQLNYYYGLAWSRYNQDLNTLEQNLAEPQRIERQQDLSAAFHRDLVQATANIFTDPDMRVRFNQLYLQYRWYTAFNDQFIQQQLNLNYSQDLEFRKLDEEWNQQMAILYDNYPLNRIAVTTAFNRICDDFYDNVASILSPQQLSLWKSLTGELFEFTPDDYFL